MPRVYTPFLERVLYSQGWSQPHYVAKGVFELLIFLLLLPRDWVIVGSHRVWFYTVLETDPSLVHARQALPLSQVSTPMVQGLGTGLLPWFCSSTPHTPRLAFWREGVISR